MLSRLLVRSGAEAEAKLAALDRSQGIIEFDLAGRVLAANANFLAVMGYELDEIQGRHHRMFVDHADAESPEYAAFWASLREGRSQSARYRRLGKGGREVWIEASYNPVLDRRGRPCKIVKFATDITERKAKDAQHASEIAAIRKSQAVITFALDGTILDANANFLAATGYARDEIVGRHHRLFVEPATAESRDYADFWASLRQGTYQSGQYKRIGRGGREVWIEASYNPIFDASGKPYQVVKFASDVTGQVRLLSDLKRLIDENFGAIEAAVLTSGTQSTEAAQAAQSTAGQMQMLAAASEELAASVAEIATSMANARAATDKAQEEIHATGEIARALTDTATAMSGIVGLIQTIAGQINLLALNATIEAARAGEAGRGFAVVAQEVKNLAGQAARATQQIGGEIDRVQAVAQNVAAALGAIEGSVETLRSYVVGTAAAVEEQSAVTRDMSANMHSSATAVASISSNVAAISSSVERVSEAVTSTAEAAQVLVRDPPSLIATADPRRIARPGKFRPG